MIDLFFVSITTEESPIASTTEKPRIALTTEEPRIALTTEEPRIALTTEEPHIASTTEEPRIALTTVFPKRKWRPSLMASIRSLKWTYFSIYSLTVSRDKDSASFTLYHLGIKSWSVLNVQRERSLKDLSE